MDLNPNCLDHTAKRLARYQPQTHLANVLQPIAWNQQGFDSIALNYVLHCLPGNMVDKGAAFGYLKALLNPGGTLFGATVLHDGVNRNLAAKALARYLNARQLFSNRHDSLAGLRDALQAHYTKVEIKVVGAVALFAVRA